MFWLLMKDRGDDDTVELFSGTLDDCHTFANGYTSALVDHTSYRILKHEGEVTIFKSPLVSLSDLEMWIDAIPMNMSDS